MKVERIQQEILKVNGKAVLIEAGAIVNVSQLTGRELMEAMKFLNNSVVKQSNKILRYAKNGK